MIKNNVLIGKDGWLFLYSGSQNQFSFLKGEKKIDAISVDNFLSNIHSRREYCRRKSIDFCHIVFPSKPVVKIKYLPHEHNDIKSLFRSYFQKRLDSDSGVFYPFEELEKLDENHSSFHKYNTHNSDRGYLEIVKFIFSKLDYEICFEDFIEGFDKRMVGGDLANMISLSSLVEEDFVILKKNKKVYRVGNRKYLQGNTGDVVILNNESSLSKKRLLVFGDSFIKDSLKFLIIYFREIFYIRSRFFHQDIVEAYSPDVVFTSNAERYLCSVKSDKEANNFIMSLYGNKNYKPEDSYLEALKACLSYKYYPNIYMSWLSAVKMESELEPFARLSSTVDSRSKAEDILREVALAFERIGDEQTALIVMQKALEVFPTGPFIKKKVNEYQAFLSNEKN